MTDQSESLDLRLAFGQVGAVQDIPLSFQRLEYIANLYFRDSQGAIDMSADDTEIDVSYLAEWEDVYALFLHQRSGQLNRNRAGSGKAQSISMLFAPYYAPRRTALGVMFDRGYATHDDPNEGDYAAMPREGCAIFLGAIADRRSDDDFATQTLYTAIHELGHVFNIGHNDKRTSYMSRSPANSLPPNSAMQFKEEEKKWLSNAPVDSMVWPGGWQYIGKSSWDRPEEHRKAPKNKDLNMRLSVGKHEFARCEPVELDITIRPKSRTDTVRIPDMIDPGYEAFDIWIETPSGERRKYRPINHYCPTRSWISVSADEPFKRDISIFGQSGGMTFVEPGYYQIYAELKPNQKSVVRSNTVTIEILSMDYLSVMAIKVLNQKWVQRTLFYRTAPFSGRLKGFSDLVLQEAVLDPALASAHYALVRTLYRAGQHRNLLRDGLRDRILTHADLAEKQSGFLGLKQKQHIEEICGTL